MSKVLFLSGDLIFASRVRAAAEAAGFTFQLSGNIPAETGAAEASPQDGTDITWIIIDLATRSGIVSDVVETARERYPEARLIAYAPHVQVGRLQAARDAGVPTVLTRGQFDGKLSSLFQGTVR